MMEYPEIVCMRDQMRETLLGKRIERDLFGQPGRFTPHVRKETVGQPCRECGAIITRAQFEGGACYVCPGCQLPPSK